MNENNNVISIDIPDILMAEARKTAYKAYDLLVIILFR